ncbi:MAG: asparagine synthase (glutamine-hydrolyzing) [Fibrobacter sp.]|nr:asparagine synthase (glutamine-hydrolyzing) [Fibrobacter sp.]
MCGICGFAGSGDIRDLQNMNEVLSHRGPDAEGCWSDPEKGIYLAHKRLSILDIQGGAQPMWTANGDLGITFNGEIYNYLELRELLEKAGHHFISSHSDTEVLLHGYKEWGARLPSKLNGMWAFAIYDRKHNQLFLSRDRFGKKPLFYTYKSGTFMFASELSSLRQHSLFEASVSILSLKKYFAYGYIPAPNSVYNSVYKLPGGHNLLFDISERKLNLNRYWEFKLEPFESEPPGAEELWCEQIRDLLEKAVKRRMISDVPLGIFLSGGVDSSSIARFASKFKSGKDLKTFSIGFEEPSFDESKYSAFAAGLIGSQHHHRTLSLQTAKDLLESIISRLDEPMGDSSLLPTFLLCKETRQHVTVALGGDGADELFAGYDPFRALHLAEMYSKLTPRPLHKAVQMIIQRMPVSHVNMSLDFKIKRTLRGISYNRKIWNPVWLGPLDPGGLGDLFGEKADIDSIYSEAIECWDTCESNDPVDKTLQFYTRLYLQDDILVKVDRASMMNSLEVRAPYLDIDLVDFVRRIPSSYKFRNGQTKYILKKALEPLLPSEILYRSKKGFGVPVGKWFQKKMLSLSGDRVHPELRADFTRQQSEEHTGQRADNRGFLWNFWVLEKFLGKV